MIEFVSSNWANLLLILVGTFAVIIYFLQERRKSIDAASLIILQIDDLQKRLQEISSYVINQQLNSTAFYESLPLIEDDYWGKYKHLFVKQMDATSFSSLNKFYDYVSVIQEQQELMKNLQKNSFVATQTAITNIESHFLTMDLNNSWNGTDSQQLITSLMNTIPQGTSEEDKNIIQKFLQQSTRNNPNADINQLSSIFDQQKRRIVEVVSRNGFTPYIPEQIRISLEKAIKEYSLLSVIGSEGYQLLKKISKRRI